MPTYIVKRHTMHIYWIEPLLAQLYEYPSFFLVHAIFLMGLLIEKSCDLNTSPFPVNVGRTGAFTPTPRLCRDCPPGTPGDGRLHLRHRNGWNPSRAIFKCHFQTKLQKSFLSTARDARRRAHCWIFGRRHQPKIRQRRCSTKCASAHPAWNAFGQARSHTSLSKAFSRQPVTPYSVACLRAAREVVCRDLVPMQLFRQQKSTEE